MSLHEDDLFVFDESVPKNNRKHLVLIIYDISDNRKRAKMAKMLEGFGVRVQKSAFESIMKQSEYKRLLKQVEELINEQNDYLRIYRLSGNTEIKTWGKIGKTEEEEFIIL